MLPARLVKRKTKKKCKLQLKVMHITAYARVRVMSDSWLSKRKILISLFLFGFSFFAF